MNIRIPFVLFVLSLAFWSCDDPKPFNDNTYLYNPFTFTQDSLHSISELIPGNKNIEWGNHLRAWVGETKYYKSGFSMDFNFADTSHDMAAIDSIQILFRHQMTFPENGADTLTMSYQLFDFRKITQPVDIESNNIGEFLGIDTMSVAGINDYWSYTLPGSTIMAGDTSISLGIFPAESGTMSAIYGGGSTVRPSLVLYYHELDTAGVDSVTAVSFLTDSLYIHLIQKSGGFDSRYAYLSQLSADSLNLTIDLNSLKVEGDTLIHIISSELLLAIIDDASSLYRQTSSDTQQQFAVRVTDLESSISANLVLGLNSVSSANEIKTIIQRALDEDRNSIELTLRSNHQGFDPGFIAVSREPSESAIYVSTSMAVRP